MSRRSTAQLVLLSAFVAPVSAVGQGAQTTTGLGTASDRAKAQAPTAPKHQSMPQGLGPHLSRGSQRDENMSWSVALWRDAGALPDCRPSAAARGRGQWPGAGGQQGRRHNPTLDAADCLSVDHRPSLYGGLYNGCPYPVEVLFCNERPAKDSWADSFNCNRQSLGLVIIGADERAALHTHRAEATRWAACAWPKARIQYKPERNESFAYWCMEDMSQAQTLGSERPPSGASGTAAESCRPQESEQLAQELATARQQAEAERMSLEKLWAQEADALRAEAEGRPRVAAAAPQGPAPQAAVQSGVQAAPKLQAAAVPGVTVPEVNVAALCDAEIREVRNRVEAHYAVWSREWRQRHAPEPDARTLAMLRRDSERTIASYVAAGRQPGTCDQIRWKIHDWRKQLAGWPESRRGHMQTIANEREPITRASAQQSLALKEVWVCAQRNVLPAMEAACGK